MSETWVCPGCERDFPSAPDETLEEYLHFQKTHTNGCSGFIAFQKGRASVIAELKEAGVIGHIENLITSSFNMYEANNEEIECRNDEDCDHCFWVSVIHDVKKDLPKLKKILGEE